MTPRELEGRRHIPTLSVVIATRHRPDDLQRCLESLCQQSGDAVPTEIVVVDDGPSADTQAVVNQYEEAHRNIQYAPNEGNGLAAARNFGAQVSTGEVIAFMDDDTVAKPYWAYELVHGFGQWGCDCVGGRVVLELASPAESWMDGMWGYFSELDLGDKPLWLVGPELPVGANLAVTRSAFDEINGFRDDLGRTARSLMSNEDNDFCLRLRASGRRIVYAPGACVQHRIAAERLTMEWLRRRAYAQGASDVVVAEMSYRQRCLRLPFHMLRLARLARMALGDLRRRRPFVGVTLELAQWRGRRDQLLGRGLSTDDRGETEKQPS